MESSPAASARWGRDSLDKLARGRVPIRHLLFFTLGYIALAVLGYALSFKSFSFATIWPASGLYLSALLLTHKREWSAYIKAAFIAQLIFDVLLHERSFLTSAGYWLSNTTEALLGAFLVRKFAARDFGSHQTFQFDSIRAIGSFLLGGVLIGPFVASFIGSLAVHLTYDAPLLKTYLHWWIADMLGITVLAPLLISWAVFDPNRLALGWRVGREDRITAIFVVPFIATIVAISLFPELRILYLPMPFIMAMGIASGLRWLSGAIFLELCWLAYLTSQDSGPFYALKIDAHIALQVYSLVTVFTALVVATLVHERRRHEQEGQQRLSEKAAVAEKLRAVMSAASSTSIIATDPSGLIEVFSPGAEKMLGYNAGEMIRKKTPASFHDVDEVIVRGSELTAELGRPVSGFEAFVAHARTGKIETRDWTYIRQDGERLIVSLSVSALHDDLGQISGFLGVAVDVTEQRSMVRELEESRRRFASAIAGANDAIWEFRHDTSAFFMSARGREMLGYEALDHNSISSANVSWVTPLIHPDELKRVEENFQDCILGRRDRISVECRMRHTNGQYVWILIRGIVSRDQFGGGLILCGSWTDITSQKIMISQMMDARQAAEDASRSKSEFLANMSHEIRTPMNGVIGMTTLALETDLSAEQRDYIQTAKDSADSLLVIINDILDFSKLEAGKLSIVNSPFNIYELGRRIERFFKQRADEQGLSFVVSFDNGTPKFVIGDSQRLQQILVNLVGNAIKFTKKGGVELKFGSGSRTDGSLLISFSVRDTGIGIPKAFLANLFDPFTQADASITRSYGGTGLGLAITKRLVDAMLGSITCTSEEGQGSTFKVEVPMALASSREASNLHLVTETIRQPRDRVGEGRRILLVEDNPVNQKLSTTLLRRQGFFVEVAERGDVATERAREAPWDLILMDIQMPGISGLEATRRIRNSEAVGGLGHTPIIAMTARALPEDEQNCIAAGMDAYLSKPINAPQFLAVVEKFLTHEESLEGKEQPSRDTIDIQAILDRAGGDFGILKEAVALFIETWPEQMEKVIKAVQSGDHVKLNYAIHSFNGAASNFFPAETLKLGHAIEARSRSQPVSAQDREDVASLQILVERLSAELSRLVLVRTFV